jgi:hypothetical protein
MRRVLLNRQGSASPKRVIGKVEIGDRHQVKWVIGID